MQDKYKNHLKNFAPLEIQGVHNQAPFPHLSSRNMKVI